jgi:hypothetical protein
LFANIEENEMASRGVMAIDFGTANTYFCKCPDDQVSPKGVDFDGKNAGLDTAILHREGKEPLIGHTAFEEFGEATAEHNSNQTSPHQQKLGMTQRHSLKRSSTMLARSSLTLNQRIGG